MSKKLKKHEPKALYVAPPRRKLAQFVDFVVQMKRQGRPI